MKDVALDACCLINLLAAECVFPNPGDAGKATGAPPGSSTPFSLGLVLHVPTIVLEECFYMYQPDPDDPGRLVQRPIDLIPYLKSGVLRPCEVKDDESDLFVNYATQLDDGEAACLALAKSRGWSLATDDRLAANMAIGEGVALLTTAELMKRWAERSKATEAAVADALANIRRFAKFVPRRSSAEAEWWFSHFAPA